MSILKRMRPNSWVKALSGAAVIWTFLPDDHSSASAIHHAFRSQVWREAGPAGRLQLTLGFVLWGPVTVLLALLCTRRCGGRVRQAVTKSRRRQLCEQLALALTLAVAPPWYYMFELYDDAKGAHASDYIYRFETKRGLYETLRAAFSSVETTDALSDKAAFERRCSGHGVAAVPVLATVRRGVIASVDASSELPRQSLFFKPLRGAGGRGAERWLFESDELYHGAAAATLSGQALAAHARQLSKKEPYLIRKYVTQHREMADLSAGALSTVRVLTCLDENGRPEVTHAVLRMASDGKVVVDNFHAGGIASAVDIADGTLGRASDMGLAAKSRWWDYHPATGAPITGRKIPYWNDVLDLARAAHAAFPDQVAIGWDIAVLDDGPRLVEGNKSPDLDIIQRIYGHPVGNSRFGQLMAFHVGRAVAIRNARSSRNGRRGRRVARSRRHAGKLSA